MCECLYVFLRYVLQFLYRTDKCQKAWKTEANMTMYKHECRGEGDYWSEWCLAWYRSPERWTGRQMGIMKEKSMYHLSSDVSAALQGTLADWLPVGLRAAFQQILLTDHLKIDGVPLFHIFLSQLPDRPEGQNKALGRIIRSCKKVTFLELSKKTNDNACRNLCSFLSIT